MKKKLFLLIIILYLSIGVWFYLGIKNSNTLLEICPQNITEPSSEVCDPQKFTMQEEIIGAFSSIIFWLPMIVGTGLRG